MFLDKDKSEAHAEEYHLDADHIGVIGASAGGHLAMMVGTTNGDSKYEDPEMGNEDYSSNVQACISWYAVTDLIPLGDTEVNYHQSVDFYNKMVEVCGEDNVKPELFPAVDHAVSKFISEENSQRVIDWLDEVLAD